MADQKFHYTTDYLQRYLNGELSDKEMQALEKAALDDPFLSDAIEGLEEVAKHTPAFESGVADLQKRLREKVRERTRKKGIVFLYPRWQVAASIIVVVSLTVLTVTLIKQNGAPKTISLEPKKDTSQKTVTAPTAPVQTATDTIQVKPEQKSPDITAASPKRFEKTRVQENLPERAPVPKVTEQDESGFAKKSQPSAAHRGEYKNLNRRDSLSYVQGLVLDDSGDPIPFASVHLPGHDKKVVTDTNGYFKLYVEKNKKEQEIAINGIGYKSKDTVISSDSSLAKYWMEPAATALNEVVVQAFGDVQAKKALTASAADVEIGKSQPVGWQELIKYINDHKKINTADSVLKGEEIISFVLNKKGNLSSFKVVKSISPSHDAEVIRLIKSGPKLQPADGKKQRLQISIFFN